MKRILKILVPMRIYMFSIIRWLKVTEELILIPDNEESLGEMHMKDYIDVSNQDNTAPD